MLLKIKNEKQMKDYKNLLPSSFLVQEQLAAPLTKSRCLSLGNGTVQIDKKGMGLWERNEQIQISGRSIASCWNSDKMLTISEGDCPVCKMRMV